VIDTGMILQVRDALEVLVTDLLSVGTECARLAERHRETPMVGRTLLQHATPITFGLKAAHWLSLATRQVRLLRDLRGELLVVQFGGAAGTLASLGDKGVQVTELLAEELDLAIPDLPWHTDRDRVAAIAGALGVVSGAMAKIARDVVLLMQTEVAEVAEAPESGKGGSSTMPQKRNPVDATAAIASAQLAFGLLPVAFAATVQEHERGAGNWQTEWIAVPDLLRYTAGAVAGVRSALRGLEVNTERMGSNLEMSRGLVMAEALAMALAPSVGKHEAHQILAAASRRATEQDADLRSIAAKDSQILAHLSPDALDQIFDPLSYLGSSNAFVQRALESFRAVVNSIEVAP
jgi:3-carboxy-cis,cis-muconate cycloisomerase